ncbi:MAG: universal stress protein [Pseudomonadota bacterium]
MTDSSISTILAVVNNRDDGEIVLDKAFTLAQHARASLHVVHVVHSAYAELPVHTIETSQELKTFILQAEESVVEELLEPLMNRGVSIESATIWHKREYEGILDVAHDCGADLIIKATEFPVTEVIRTPTDWNLLRHSDVPVMLVKPINWVETPVIMAALNMTVDQGEDALNDRILTRTKDLATALNGKIHVVTTYPSVEQWVGPLTVIVDFDAVRRSVSKNVTNRVNEVLHKLGIAGATIHALEGDPATVIQQIVAETGAEVLVMGTHHRSGAKGIVLGNTSEKILHHVKSDVEVLH